MKKYIMPPLALTIICTAVCALLVGAYKLTYVDNTGVMTDELKAGCEEIFPGGDFEMLLDTNNEEKAPVTFGSDKINSVITDGENVVFEVTADGYSKGGIHVLVGINQNGSVEGISFVSCGETPGLGTKVSDAGYLSKFKGADKDSSLDDIENITGATYSSKGLKDAVKTAVQTYSEHREEILR